eukprot:1684556-Prymnesium_polylepis.2
MSAHVALAVVTQPSMYVGQAMRSLRVVSQAWRASIVDVQNGPNMSGLPGRTPNDSPPAAWEAPLCAHVQRSTREGSMICMRNSSASGISPSADRHRGGFAHCISHRGGMP